ncbi:hypothetical protein QTP70_029007 [Hemibagrus guttatus]|uniref:Integrase zinc-binding domain-containing protein n=1 Tax=Hemibagrus guttatus TaxID=175788 RepID=A0AAE0REQ2_9TELE|nr:hypothetical protein QTP70_029007 [Hemibagrus guttatus]KAK3571355.1 hypothetical protein QTP86_008268 [Hemibagrus guttatus]
MRLAGVLCHNEGPQPDAVASETQSPRAMHAEPSYPGESEKEANPLSSLSQQVTKEGSFGREQKEDDWLKHCWGQVLQAEVQAFCQACPRCQQTAPQKPALAPLISLPIIGVPFEHIGMDLVGPLLKSAWGHE